MSDAGTQARQETPNCLEDEQYIDKIRSEWPGTSWKAEASPEPVSLIYPTAKAFLSCQSFRGLYCILNCEQWCQFTVWLLQCRCQGALQAVLTESAGNRPHFKQAPVITVSHTLISCSLHSKLCLSPSVFRLLHG